MKTKTLLLNLLLLAVFSFKGKTQILNAGFENWTNTGFGYEDPDDWHTLNSISLIGGPVTASKTTTAHSGTYALKLEALTYTSFSGPDTLPGTAFNAFPFTQRPAVATAYCKYTPTKTGDMAIIALGLFKWNSSTQSNDTIGKAAAFITSNTGYTLINMPFTYGMGITPDSISVMIISSIGAAPATLLVDDIGTSGVAAVDPVIQQTVKAVLFPNPVKDILNIYSFESGNSIEIYDLLGNLISTHQCFGTLSRFNIENYSEGIYLYNIKDNRGVSISKGKFTVIE